MQCIDEQKGCGGDVVGRDDSHMQGDALDNAAHVNHHTARKYTIVVCTPPPMLLANHLV